MFIAAILLILAVTAFRLVTGLSGAPEWSNFSPMAAVVLCGAAFLPRRFAIVIPLAAMLVSDVVLNLHYGMPAIGSLMLVIFYIGFRLRDQASRGEYHWKLFAGTVAGSLLFYLLANTGAWLSSPGYAKTVAGWVQSQTVGLAPFPPSYLFLRNSMVSDLLFTGLFFACFVITAKRSSGAAATTHLVTTH